MRELPSAAPIVRACEQREQYFVRGQADAQIKPEIAVVGNQDVFAALKCHRCAGLHRFVPFTGRRKRNFALTIQLETTRF